MVARAVVEVFVGVVDEALVAVGVVVGAVDEVAFVRLDATVVDKILVGEVAVVEVAVVFSMVVAECVEEVVIAFVLFMPVVVEAADPAIMAAHTTLKPEVTQYRITVLSKQRA